MRGMILVLVGIFLAAASMAAAAVPTATISVPAAGEYYCWFAYPDVDGKQVHTTPRGFKDKKMTVEVPLVKDGVPDGTTVYVLDAKTGNEAILPVGAKPGEPIKVDLKKSDFSKVRRVQVSVSAASSGESAAAAIVKLEDDEGKVQTRVLDPASNGVTEFTDVPEGTASVTILYGDGKRTSQDVDIALDRERPVPLIDVPVVGEIETLGPVRPADAGGAVGQEPTEERTRARQQDWLTAIIGIVLFAGIVYVAYVTMRNRGASFRSFLRRFGVELPVAQAEPQEPQPQPAPQAEPGTCPFCGQRKDPATGSCACSVTAAPGSAVSSGPRLVAIQGPHLGQVYDLQPGTVTIGREESNTIAFPDDSTVSRSHAQISSSNGSFTIYDQGSSNGTFVNGVKVAEQVLSPGDEIQIGSTRLRFEA